MARVLIIGGAGYIGSHTIRVFADAGLEIAVYDNLSNGHRESLPDDVELFVGDLKDVDFLNRVFREGNFDAVVHLAGFIEAGESMKNPAKYYENNVCNSFNLLNVMMKNNVRKILFSSSASVYGNPESVPIAEGAFKNPVSVYGETKLIVEKMLRDFERAYGFSFIGLRYFNAAGADFGIGEHHEPESHLIPLILQVALGKRENVKLFGTDYDTYDGTCVRDYIHVSDIASAHLLALKKLLKGCESDFYNLGSGRGYSVREIVEIASEVSGVEIPVVEDEKRGGDPAVLAAYFSKARERLGWVPQRDMKKIIESAWEWHRRNPDGFRI